MTRNSGDPQEADAKVNRKREQARERKRRFDLRMTNADFSNGKERRYALQIFLTKGAKQVIERVKENHKKAGEPKLFASQIIEGLLRYYQTDFTVENTNQSIAADEGESEGVDWDLVHKKLLAAHRQLAKHFEAKKYSGDPSLLDNLQAFNRGFPNYLEMLVETVSGQDEDSGQ
jgi:hypothetical protein